MIGRERHYYELGGSKVISQIIYNVNRNKSRLDYNYDLNGELVSVEYLGYKYFYIKDALGNINYVVDGTGSIIVKYDYDEWESHNYGYYFFGDTFFGQVTNSIYNFFYRKR